MFGGYDLDLLEIRLNTLAEVVSKFLIVEAPITHTLIPKPLVFLENQSRFEQFKDKIIYMTAECRHDNPFVNDWNYRNILFDNIPNPKFDDVILMSDLDEISHPEILKESIDNLTQPLVNETSYRFFCVNLEGRKSNDTIILRHDCIKDDIYKYRDARNKGFFRKVENAGWHFSSCGNLSNIVKKLNAFAHAIEVPDYAKNEDFIKSQIRRKAGDWNIDSPDNTLKQLDINYENLPRFLVDNQERFKHLFYDFYKE
jgi:beta-1,4-mannosyl-glycoprotein beta-1,4-N-acetylglucosaminyltransferase